MRCRMQARPTWSMVWLAPVSRSSPGRSADRMIIGTLLCDASTTAGSRLATAVPEEVITTACVLQPHRAKISNQHHAHAYTHATMCTGCSSSCMEQQRPQQRQHGLPIGLPKAQGPERQGALVNAGHYPGARVHGCSCCQRRRPGPCAAHATTSWATSLDRTTWMM